jgi:hypothetical protein
MLVSRPVKNVTATHVFGAPIMFWSVFVSSAGARLCRIIREREKLRLLPSLSHSAYSGIRHSGAYAECGIVDIRTRLSCGVLEQNSKSCRNYCGIPICDPHWMSTPRQSRRPNMQLRQPSCRWCFRAKRMERHNCRDQMTLPRKSKGKSTRAKRDTKKGAKTCPFGSSMVSLKSGRKFFGMNGGDDETRTRDLCRDSLDRFYNDLQRPRGLPKYAEVVQDIAFCGLGCGLGISDHAGHRGLFLNFSTSVKYSSLRPASVDRELVVD